MARWRNCLRSVFKSFQLAKPEQSSYRGNSFILCSHTQEKKRAASLHVYGMSFLWSSSMRLSSLQTRNMIHWPCSLQTPMLGQKEVKKWTFQWDVSVQYLVTLNFAILTLAIHCCMDVYITCTVSFWKKLAYILLLSDLKSLNNLLERAIHIWDEKQIVYLKTNKQINKAAPAL